MYSKLSCFLIILDQYYDSFWYDADFVKFVFNIMWIPNFFFFLEFGGFGSVSGKIEIEIKINHEGEVNR